ncbi:magnesium transporter [Dokdonella sp.]|uniref:magnesium transporter n=1 Tax=Dokdonella sp. TaxID=2291710 RepID=UPI0031C2F7B3|nr:magnesium transporter [Dokdonella sp.]
MSQEMPSARELREMDAEAAVKRLSSLPDPVVARLLHELGPARAVAILDRFGAARRRNIAGTEGATWLAGMDWPEGSVGRLMEAPPAVFTPETTVAAAIEALRPLVTHRLITYLFIVDAARHLLGVVAFREIALARAEQRLGDLMLPQPFSLRPETSVIVAMRDVVQRHYPVYPVCDHAQHLLGVVRGSVLFEQQAYEISAQAGTMVGVEKEERLATSWQRSLRMRNPWLQVNLLTTFITAAVVGSFQDTINHIVLLAVFLPVLSDQCNNTGSQALAVTLRGLTFGELKSGQGLRLVVKEGWLGFLNGALTGLLAALAMFVLARYQGNANAPLLAFITFAALAGSCVLAGVVGTGVPQVLRRCGADPATASSIFLTKATDVGSLGLFLGLAAWLLET